MEKWVYVVGTNCRVAGKEDEFNRWYDTVHLPDVLTMRDFVSAQRFEVKDPAPGKPRFLAVYNVETDDIDKTMAELAEFMKNVRAAGRVIDLVDVVDRAMCRQTAARKKQ